MFFILFCIIKNKMTTFTLPELKECILSVKDISPKSAQVYVSNIRLLLSRMMGVKPNELKELDVDMLKDYKKVKPELDKLSSVTKKNYISAILVALRCVGDDDETIDTYSKVFQDVVEKFSSKTKEQEVNDKDKENWVSLKDLQRAYKKYMSEIKKRKLLDRDNLTKPEFNQLLNGVILTLYLGSPNNPPLRTEYSEMRVIPLGAFNELSDAEKEKHNYLVYSKKNLFFSIGDYKTVKTHGVQQIPVDKKIETFLRAWIDSNESDWLLPKVKKMDQMEESEPMGNNLLSKRFSSLMKEMVGKNIGVSLLRKIFITDTLEMPSIKKREKLADAMLHTADVQSLYYSKPEMNGDDEEE